jgi:hypothetical protein
VPALIVGSAANISNAINSFLHAYHADYSWVRAHGQAYVAAPLSHSTVAPLARALRCVLERWGAETRGAPTLRPIAEFEGTLGSTTLHTNLKYLAGTREPLAKGSTND